MNDKNSCKNCAQLQEKLRKHSKNKRYKKTPDDSGVFADTV
jgi:hypothetical protein